MDDLLGLSPQAQLNLNRVLSWVNEVNDTIGSVSTELRVVASTAAIKAIAAADRAEGDVNAAIKRQLCQDHGGAAWLRRVRPWRGHDSHMHIRLRCPADSPECRDIAPPPPGEEDIFLADWRADPHERRDLAADPAHAAVRDTALDLLAEELRLAHRALMAITGEYGTEDLLGAIFGRFCIGK
jgi:murein endopeptidase